MAKLRNTVSWVRFEMRVFCLARKVSKTDKWRRNKSCLFLMQFTTLGNRRLSSRRWIKIPYKVYMSRGKPQDKTLSKRHRASQRMSKRSRLKIHDTTKTTGHDARKSTSAEDAIGSEFEIGKRRDTTLANQHWASRRVSTRPSRFKFCEYELREATRHDSVKPTPSVKTPVVATLTQDTNNLTESCLT